MNIKTRLFSSILFLIISISTSYSGVSATDQEVVQKIERFLNSKHQKGNIPGFAVAIVNKEGIVFANGYGHDGNGLAVTPTTPFAIASLSKAFTALSVMQLVEQGKVCLDDPITQYIPSLPQSNITIRHLLNQTSGFSDRVFPEMQFYSQPDDLDQAIERMIGVSLISPPGEKYHYHNPNYILLAKIVEATSGKYFSDYLEEHVLSPLGMQHTINAENTDAFYSQERLRVPPGYNFIFGYPYKMKEPAWYVQGSAGIISTVEDMSKWLILFLNKGVSGNNRLLSENGITQMTTPPGGSTNFYGMGWGVDSEKNFSHNGILWSYQSEQIILTCKGYGIVLLFNGGLNIFQNYSSYKDGLVDILNGKDPSTTSMPTYWPEIMIALLLLVYLWIACMKLKKPYISRPKNKLRFWLQNLLMLLPFILLLLPQAVTFLSGRVMNWERIFWTMPSVCIALAVISLLNLLLIIKRIYQNSKY